MRQFLIDSKFHHLIEGKRRKKENGLCLGEGAAQLRQGTIMTLL